MKTKIVKILNSRMGFSLAEVMVGAGLLGIVSLVMMNSLNTTQNITKKTNQDQVIESAVAQVRGVLNKIRLPDTPVGALTCDDVIAPGGALQANIAPNSFRFNVLGNLGQGVTLTAINAAFTNAAVAERKTVEVVMSFDVSRDRQTRTVTRTIQTMVALDVNDNVSGCLSYDAQRIRDPADNDSCLLIFTDCAAQNILNPPLQAALSTQICEALGTTFNAVSGKCDAVIVEEDLESTNLTLTGADADFICIDGANCRQVFDNTACPAGTQLRGMGIEGEGGDPTGKTCENLSFPAAVSTPPGTCPELNPASVPNCTLPQTIAAATDTTVSGMCSGSGTCSGTCQTDGSWSAIGGSCGGAAPSISWCVYSPGQTIGTCDASRSVANQSTNSQGLLHWNCVDSGMSAPNDRVTCRTCLNNQTGVSDGSGGFVDVVNGSCECQSGMTGACTVSCNTNCGCAENDVACNNACNASNGWVVGSNTCFAGPPDTLFLTLGSGSSSAASPEMTLEWDTNTTQFVKKDGSAITPATNINLNPYITLYGGVPPYSGSWTVGDTTWQVTNTTTDPSTSVVNFTDNNTASFSTQTIPDEVYVELSVTDSNAANVVSGMWVNVSRKMDCADYTVEDSDTFAGPSPSSAQCFSDASAQRSACTAQGCYLGLGTYDNACSYVNPADREWEVDCFPNPTCSPSTVPAIPNGAFNPPSDGSEGTYGMNSGQILTANCSAGHTGTVTTQCQASGSWSAPVGTCAPSAGCYEWSMTGSSVMCFIGETGVKLPDGSTSAIKNLVAGDLIVNGSGAVVTVKENTKYSHMGRKYSINGSEYFFTDSHPFKSVDGWVAISPNEAKKANPELIISQMKIGNILIKNNGKYEEVKEIDYKETGEPVYSISVTGNQEFVANDYVVHNKPASATCGLPGQPQDGASTSTCDEASEVGNTGVCFSGSPVSGKETYECVDSCAPSDPCNLHNSLAACEGEYGSGNCKIIDGTVTNTSIHWSFVRWRPSMDIPSCTVSGPGTEGPCTQNPSSCPGELSGSGGNVPCSSNGHLGLIQVCGFEFDGGGPFNRNVSEYRCTESMNTPDQYTSNSCGTYSCTPDCSAGPGPDGCGGTCSFDCLSTTPPGMSNSLPYKNIGATANLATIALLCESGGAPRINTYECTGAGPYQGWQQTSTMCP